MKKIPFVFIFIWMVLITSCTTIGNKTRSTEKEEYFATEYMNIAKGYQDNKNYTKAIEYYLLAEKSKKYHDNAYYELGRCYTFQKDWISAEKVFSDLLNKDKENLNLRLSLIYITAMEGKLSQAEQQYKELSYKYPNDASIQKNLISVLLAEGKYEIAEEQFYLLKEKFPEEKELSDLFSKISSGLENTEKK